MPVVAAGTQKRLFQRRAFQRVSEGGNTRCCKLFFLQQRPVPSRVSKLFPAMGMDEGRNALARKGTKHTERSHAVRQHDHWSLRLMPLHVESIARQTMYTARST